MYAALGAKNHSKHLITFRVFQMRLSFSQRLKAIILNS